MLKINYFIWKHVLAIFGAFWSVSAILDKIP